MSKRPNEEIIHEFFLCLLQQVYIEHILHIILLISSPMKTYVCRRDRHIGLLLIENSFLMPWEVIKPTELPSCLCCWMTLRGTYNCTSRHVLLSSSLERLGSSGSSIFTSPSSKSSWVSSASKVETIN
uniref:Uncharacterized protein n=1 Tax=Glossina pallidipes TaxID=7398 RepID=A0A1B0AH65_GLOPL